MMKRFKNILVVLDAQNISEDNEALKRAFILAKENDAALTILHVFDEPQPLLERYEDFMSPAELAELIKERKTAALEELVTPLRETGFRIGARVVSGKGFIEIINQVLRHNYDIVLKVANWRGDSFDSNDLHLLRKCPCPVWLIRNPIKSKAVLAAIDLSLEKTVDGQAMNKLIIDLAISLVKRDDAQLYILSCWTLYGEESLRNSGFLKVSKSRLNDILVAEHRENLTLQKRISQQYGLDDEQLVLVNGVAEDVIPDFVRDKHISTVVMGTVGRTGIQGLIIGNTAETVLRSIDSSVIAVKPDSFVSPVKI
ncbi:MAG: universal stress protein E [Paraglaciecola sp.]|jgi:universal stress protein E